MNRFRTFIFRWRCLCLLYVNGFRSAGFLGGAICVVLVLMGLESRFCRRRALYRSGVSGIRKQVFHWCDVCRLDVVSMSCR